MHADCRPYASSAVTQVSTRQAVIFCPTCGARHGLWTFLGGRATAVEPRWPAGSPLPPLLGGAFPCARGAAQRGDLDPAAHSAPPKARALGGDGVAVAGEGNDRDPRMRWQVDFTRRAAALARAHSAASDCAALAGDAVDMQLWGYQATPPMGSRQHVRGPGWLLPSPAYRHSRRRPG